MGRGREWGWRCHLAGLSPWPHVLCMLERALAWWREGYCSLEWERVITATWELGEGDLTLHFDNYSCSAASRYRTACASAALVEDSIILECVCLVLVFGLLGMSLWFLWGMWLKDDIPILQNIVIYFHPLGVLGTSWKHSCSLWVFCLLNAKRLLWSFKNKHSKEKKKENKPKSLLQLKS